MLTSIQKLERALAGNAADVVWLVHPDSWFELLTVARRCAAAGVSLTFRVRDDDGDVPMCDVSLADFTAAYETIRDQWPSLSGEQRPRSLAPKEYEQLAIGLRQEVTACADRRLGGVAEGTVRLGLPPIGHDLLADDDRAARFWRAFAAIQSESVRSYVLEVASRADAATLLGAHAWLRVLFQRQLSLSWNADLQQILAAVYADAGQRAALLDAERAAFAPVGLEWLTSHLNSQLGLLQPLPRNRAFRIPRARKGTVTQRDAAAVTVLIPSYRHESYVADAIRSVLAQSMAELRVLVVDDLSPDGTLAAAAAIDDPRLEVRCNPANLGLGNSVLRALETIDTPVVALLNSDDLFHPLRLEKCLGAFAADPACELVATGLALIDRDDKQLTPRNASVLFHGRNVHDWVHWYENGKPTDGGTIDLFGELLERNFLATSSNIVCRTDWLRGHADALKSLKYCLDWQLFLDAARERKLAWLPERLVAYRLHPSNTVWFEDSARWTYSLEVNRVAARAIRDHVEALPEEGPARAELALRDIAEHLRKNTEIDWTGLYLNELIGGYSLERSSRSSATVAGLAAGLKRMAWQVDEAARAAERQRAEVMAVKYAATRDEVSMLRSRDDWQKRHIEEDAERGRRLTAELHAASARADEAERRLQASRAETDAVAAALHDVTAKLDQANATSDRRRRDLDDAEAQLRRLREDLDRNEGELESSRAALARAAAELEGAFGRLAVITPELAQARQSLAAMDARVETLQSELAAEIARREQLARKAAGDLAAWQLARNRLEATQRALAEVAARQQLEQATQQRSWLLFRGTRFVPGSTTLRLLRRMGKWRRKLGAAASSLTPRLPHWRLAKPVIATTITDADELLELRSLCAEAAARPCPVVVRDGNTPAMAAVPTLAADAVVAWWFPEHGRRHWRYFCGRAPERAALLLESLAAVHGGDEARAIAAIAPHLAFARAAQGQHAAMLFAGGGQAELTRIAVAARLLGVPFAAVVEQLETGDDSRSRWLRSQLAEAALLIARAPSLRNALIAGGVDATRVVVCPGPVVPCEPQLPAAAPPRLLALGPVEAGVGWGELVTAAAIVRDRGTSFRLQLAGTVMPESAGALATAASVRAMLPSFGLPADVTFAASLEAEQRRLLLAPRPAVFVAPWCTAGEPAAIDRGVLAAMAAGLPIVGSTIPAITAAVRHDVEALLVPPGQVRALADALARLLQDTTLQQRLGAAARTRYCAEFAPVQSRSALAERVRLLLPR